MTRPMGRYQPRGIKWHSIPLEPEPIKLLCRTGWQTVRLHTVYLLGVSQALPIKKGEARFLNFTFAQN